MSTNYKAMIVDRINGCDRHELINFLLDRLETLPVKPIHTWSEDALRHVAVDMLLRDQESSQSRM
jgi:hypothetical protein